MIVCYTESGSTGIKVSRVRPKQMILTVTPIVETARKLTLVWGVKCIVQKDANNLEEMIKMTKAYSKREKISTQRFELMMDVLIEKKGRTE